MGCGEGGCGACSVIAVGPDEPQTPQAINACLRLLCACDGYTITTVEGLGAPSPLLRSAEGIGGLWHPVRLCTPSWVNAMTALLAAHGSTGAPPLTAKAIEEALDGNLCRCTGYRPILQAFKEAFADDSDGRPPLAADDDVEDLATVPCHNTRTGESCARECDRACEEAKERRRHAKAEAVASTCGAAPAPSGTPAQRPPCRGGATTRAPPRSLSYSSDALGLSYRRPTSLAELQAVLQATPAARIVAANTAMGAAKYYVAGAGATGTSGQPPQRDATIVDVGAVREMALRPVISGSGVLTAGAAVTIAALIAALRPTAHALARHLARVASTQVRGVATWAGNLMMAVMHPAFASDVLTAFVTAGASVVTAPRGGGGGALATADLATWVATPSASSDLLVEVKVPLKTAASTLVYVDKVAMRHANAHAIVNAGVAIATSAAGVVTSCRVAVGGVCTSGLLVSRTAAAALCGKPITDEAACRAFVGALLDEAHAVGVREDHLHAAAYRLALTQTLAYKAFLRAQPSLPSPLASAVAGSLAAAADRPVSSGVQKVDQATDPSLAPVSTPVPKLGAYLQASGEATFASDAPRRYGELCGAYVYTGAGSTGGTLDALHLDGTLASPGVALVVTAADFPRPAANLAGKGTFKEYLLPVGGTIPAVGQPVALVLADTLAHARFAAKQATLTVGGAPAAMAPARTMEPAEFAAAADALQSEAGGRMGMRLPELRRATALAREAAGGEQVGEAPPPYHYRVLVGTPPAAWRADCGHDSASLTASTAPVMLEGGLRVGAQKHFYMETNAVVATPTEGGGMDVHTSTQDPRLTQGEVAAALGLPLHSVDCRATHVGGAYGGKLSGGAIHAAVVAAVAARKAGAPVRLHNERVDDMTTTGGRAPMEASWSAAVDPATGVVSHSRWIWSSTAAAMATAATRRWASSGATTHTSTPTTTARRRSRRVARRATRVPRAGRHPIDPCPRARPRARGGDDGALSGGGARGKLLQRGR